MRKAILISSGFLAVATVVFPEVAVVPQRAQATPAYARETGRPCGSCHVNRAGGGRLTEAGVEFAKKRR